MNLFYETIHGVYGKLTQNRVRSARKRAIHSAIAAVLNQHPDFRDTCFDEHFVANGAADIFEPFLQCGIMPDADALAEAWVSQLSVIEKTRSRAVARVTPIVNDFIYVLATETIDTPEVQSVSVDRPTLQISV